MKKNLRKIAALLAMVTAVSSMSISTFAEVELDASENILYGDIDGDGLLTANDAALLHSYALNSNAPKIKEIFEDPEVQKRAIVTPELKSESTIEEGALGVSASAAADGAAAILMKILGTDFAAVIPKTQYVQASTGQYVVSAKAPHSSTAVDALGVLMSVPSNYAMLSKEAGVLNDELANYTVDGLALSTAEGWSAFGDIILAENSDKDAFMALMPTQSPSQEYFTEFASNAKKAFPVGADTEAVKAKINARELKERNISVEAGDTVVAEGVKETLCWMVDNLLYTDKSVKDLTANGSITIATANERLALAATEA
jgi:hypothetical protein